MKIKTSKKNEKEHRVKSTHFDLTRNDISLLNKQIKRSSRNTTFDKISK